MEAFILLVAGAINIACFVIGAKVGQAASKGENIKTPTFNPLKAIQEHNDRKEAEREQDRRETILRNIENYDGTGAHQEDVPRG